MVSLDLKKYGNDLIFAELRDGNMGPGCEKFHGDAAMIRRILMSRIERRKITIEDIVSDSPELLQEILIPHPIRGFSEADVNDLFFRSLSENDMAEITERMEQTIKNPEQWA